jgi:hypothetical protein
VSHTEAAGLRSGPLPSAEIDGAGKVYVGWGDCRFRRRCTANDIVYTTSTNGTTWSPVTRIPIDAVNSGADHFLPGLAVDKNTSGPFYPVSNCTTATFRAVASRSGSRIRALRWGGCGGDVVAVQQRVAAPASG